MTNEQAVRDLRDRILAIDPALVAELSVELAQVPPHIAAAAGAPPLRPDAMIGWHESWRDER